MSYHFARDVCTSGRVKMRVRLLTVALAAMLSATAVFAQDPATQDQPQAGGGRGGRAAEPEIRPYDRVITKDAKSDDGVFTVHRIKDRVYYEIPKAQLGREFLWVSQIARTTLGAGYGGQAAGNRVVRWERRGDRILLRAVSYDVVADAATPIARAVEASNYSPIVMAFNIEALGKDDAAVIDVTRLFTTRRAGVQRPHARRRARFRRRAGRLSSGRSPSRRTSRSRPRTPTTTRRSPPPPVAVADRRRAAAVAPCRSDPGPHSVLMHYSMVLLPEKPMMPRLFDDRVGYFSVRQLDYGRDEHRSPQRRFITRWRLEKKDPNAAISEPVKPIVYWIDPATPAKWVPYMKKGIESWQAAFEAAGLQERDHRERSADARAGSRLESGGRPLLRHPLAARRRPRTPPGRTSATRAPERSSRATSSSITT